MIFTPCYRIISKVYTITVMHLKSDTLRWSIRSALALCAIALLTPPALARPQCMCPDDLPIIQNECDHYPGYPPGAYTPVTGAVCSSDNPRCPGSPDYW